MDNERTVVLENVSGQPVGLKDTQNRTYRFGVGGRIRISEVSLQDILDYPASKIIFNEGMIKVSNISANTLYKMGLTEKEIKLYLGDEYNAVVIAEEITEEPKEEEIIKIEEPVIEEKEEVEAPAVEAPAEKPAVKKTTTRKTTAKRKTSSKKSK
jgi:predicted transcriptional regulator